MTTAATGKVTTAVLPSTDSASNDTAIGTSLEARQAAARAYALSSTTKASSLSTALPTDTVVNTTSTASEVAHQDIGNASNLPASSTLTQPTNKTQNLQTPPVRPTPPPKHSKQQQQQQQNKRKRPSKKTTPPSAKRKIAPPPLSQTQSHPPLHLHLPSSFPTAATASSSVMLDEEQSEDGDSLEYQKFVNSLFASNDDLLSLPPIGEEDEDEYVVDDDKENDDGDDDDDDDDDSDGDGDDNDAGDATANAKKNSTAVNKQHSPPPMSPLSFDYDDLDAELSSLLEEDMEAAVTTLCLNSIPKNPLPLPLPHKPGVPVSVPTTNKNSKNKTGSQQKQAKHQQAQMGSSAAGGNSNSAVGEAGSTTISAPSPLSMSSPTSKKITSTPQVTSQQMNRLSTLLQSHYQILLQQGVLAVRQGYIQKSSQGGAANSSSTRDYGAETAEDLAEIIDGAVGMLQDLDQNRKDAIRNSIQQLETKQSSSGGKRSLLSALTASSETTMTDGGAKPPNQNQRLTRSAFTQIQSSTQTKARTTFDIKGLQNLKETFSIIDQSMSSPEQMTMQNDVGDACRKLLQQAGSSIQEDLIPNKKDITGNLSYPKEFFGPMFQPPTNPDQQLALRKNRNQFTAAEDNLVLRGVNLYGEKQWILIADRYLPDRSVNVISQRYSKLCLMLYKAHNIFIDEDGNLETPRKSSKSSVCGDASDDDALSKLKKVEPPAILNVHRWSLEEDLTLLKAVPYLGNMWAELSSRFIPHRDRGHLRKRYQVLERRVKATIQRAKKSGGSTNSTYTVSAQPKGGKSGHAAAARSFPVLQPPRPPPIPSSMQRSNGRKGINKKIVKGPPEVFPHPGQHLPPPQYVPRVALQPGKRMSNGTTASVASLPPGKCVALARKTPGYSLPMRPKTNNVQEVMGSSNTGPVNPHFSGVIKGSKGSKIVRPGDVQNTLIRKGANMKRAGGDLTRKKTPVTKKKKRSVSGKKNGTSKASSPATNMDSLIPEASSPELDTAATALEGTVHRFENNSTRTGFEKLLNEGSNEWSQGPRLKKMMEETDAESLVASTIVNHLATGSVAHSDRNANERLPHLDFDNNTTSGLSFLNDPGERFSSPTKAQRPSNSASIFSRVKEQTDKRGAPQEVTKKPKLASGNSSGNHFDSSPPTPVQVPSTPSRTMTPSKAFHLGSTTPIGLSGGFSPAKHCFSSPGFRGAFSPGGMMMTYSKDGASADNFEAMFEISDRSRQAFEAGVANGSAKVAQPTGSAVPTPTPYLNQPLTPSQGFYRDTHSLNPIDLDVVSALNTLSNSPARQLTMKRPAPSGGPAPSLPKDESNKRGTGEDKSFFARAIGGIRDKESKKRRV